MNILRSTNNLGCVKKALSAAGLYPPFHIPDMIAAEDMPAICDKLGLIWHTNTILQLKDEPVFVVYRTAPRDLHMVYISDIAPFLHSDLEIVAVIELPE